MRLSYTIALLLGVATAKAHETEAVPTSSTLTFADGTPVPEVIYDDEGNAMRLMSNNRYGPHESGLHWHTRDVIPW